MTAEELDQARLERALRVHRWHSGPCDGDCVPDVARLYARADLMELTDAELERLAEAEAEA